MTYLPPASLPLLPETQRRLEKLLSFRAEVAADRNATAEELYGPSFPYQSLPPSTRLRYELMDWHNFLEYLPLFAADPSPFVDARFKSREKLEDYALSLLVELSCSFKHGACDWLLRRQSDNQPLGVLHLYELSHERWAGYRPACCVGYALAAPHRRQGYGYEALRHLLTQAAPLFGQTEARAISAAENLASQVLLRRCGFGVLEERPAMRYGGAEVLWGREL